MSNQVGAVIFDVSGTVMDYGSRGPVAALVELFRRNGIEFSDDEARLADGMLPPAFDRLRSEFDPLLVEVLREHGDLIPGVVELTEELRHQGIRFANTTGLDSSVLEETKRATEENGYKPDAWVSPDMVGGAGRPAPWMAFHAAQVMGVYPMARVVKVGDTLGDIEEANAAGMWAVSVVRHGNEMGLSQQVLNALPRSESGARLRAARERLAAGKPHFLIDSTADLMPVLSEISWRLSRGETPSTGTISRA